MTNSIVSLPIEQMSVLFAAALVWLSVVVQHVANVRVRGVAYAQSDRSAPPVMEGFYGRATRTLANNMESAVMYAPSMILLLSIGRVGVVTHVAAATYIVARTLFTLTYLLRVPIVRSWSWALGMLCSATVAVLAFGAVVNL